MNFFDFNIGDYDEATSHLSSREDGLYGRMIRKYYAKEEPLPLDVAKIQRLVRCADDEDRQAVLVLLQEFFEKREDGYHKEPIDRRIEAFRSGRPAVEQKKQNEVDRKTRHNLERSRLFQAVRGVLGHVPWDTPMPELRALAAKIQAPGTPPVIGKPRTPRTHLERHLERPLDENGTAKPVTSNQEPLIDIPGESVQTPPAPKVRKPKAPSAGAKTWAAYSSAYLTRYKVEPVRNASVNGQLAQVVGKLGAEAAPQVAAYYLRHKGNLYTSAMHPVILLLRDAEKLHTEWKTKAEQPTNGTSFTREREQQAAGWMGTAAAHPGEPDYIDMEP